MSDFSALEQSFVIPAASLVSAIDDDLPLASTEVQPHEVSFRRLLGREIARVLHLRQQITLPTATIGDSGFGTREKKEMNLGSLVRSRVSANTSGPSATSP